MGQKKLWCILRRYMKILSPRQQWVYTRGTSKHSSLSKSWSSIIYEIYDHSHDGDWDHHHPNIVFFCQTPPGLSNSCSERNSFCAWSLSRCSSLRALACQQVLVFSVTSFVYMRIYPPCILSIWLTINMQTTTLITFRHVWPVHTYVEIRMHIFPKYPCRKSSSGSA